MAEVADASENHGKTETIGRSDDFFVADGAAGLNHGRCTMFGGLFDSVREGKESVRTDDGAA